MDKRLFSLATAATLVVALMSVVSAVADSPVPEETLTLDELIELSDADLSKVDIVTMNLACAEGLPGSESIDRRAVRETLDLWARAVAVLTLHRAHLFKEDPAEYEYSWAKFCARNLLRTLQLYLGVHYNHEQRTDPSMARSEDQFIHGLVQGTGGTCASLPVLYIAVGRRLGYPLKLAQGFSHYYVRWDDPVTGERFNIDGSGDGYAFEDDQRYREWPHRLSSEQLENGNYLESLSPREELSTFLTTRGDCLRENGQWAEALRTYQKAVDLAPRNLFAAGLLHTTVRVLHQWDVATHVEAMYQRHEHRRQSDPRIIVPGSPTVPMAFAHRSSVRHHPDNDFILPQPDPFGNGTTTPAPSLFEMLRNPPVEAPTGLSSGDHFEQMKRRGGIRRPDGSLAVPVPPSPARPYAHRSKAHAVPMSTIPLNPKHGVRP